MVEVEEMVEVVEMVEMAYCAVHGIFSWDQQFTLL